MREILVVANRTLGGRKLLERVRELAGEQETCFRLVVPKTSPSAGLVDLRRGRARLRPGARRPRAVAARRRGHRGHRRSRRPGSVLGDDGRDRRAPARRDHRLDPPGHAVGLAAARPDRARPQRLGAARRAHRHRPRAGGPAVPCDARGRQQDLQRRGAVERLRRRPRDGERHLFIAVVPQQGGSGSRRARRASAWRRCSTGCTGPGCSRSGMIGDPDPYTATINALELFRVDDVVISTLPGRALGLAARRT